VYNIVLVSLFIMCPVSIFAQSDTNLLQSNQTNEDSIIVKSDTLIKPEKKSSFDLENRIIYTANDSVIMDWKVQKAFLYKEAKVEYGETILKAGYIEIDFKQNTVYAKGILDSAGKVVGIPIFKDGEDEYKTDSIHYNFKSK
jgi:hypothetical protein